jgi:hypothetical protein
MKIQTPVSLVAVLLAATFAHGAPADDVTTAAQKLADAANYSWTATTTNATPAAGAPAPAAGGRGGGFNAGPTDGKTEKGGYTLITRMIGGNPSQTVLKGDKRVQQGQDGTFMTPEELAAAGGRGVGAAPVLPAVEIVTLAGKVKELKAADGVIAGDIPADAAGPLLLLGRGGRGGGAAPATPPTPPLNASGSLSIWLKDGALVKYALHLKGTVTGRNGMPTDVDRTVTTEIKDIGMTKLDVPAAAKDKLDAKPADAPKPAPGA